MVTPEAASAPFGSAPSTPPAPAAGASDAETEFERERDLARKDETDFEKQARHDLGLPDA